jgi:hypothetical protein
MTTTGTWNTQNNQQVTPHWRDHSSLVQGRECSVFTGLHYTTRAPRGHSGSGMTLTSVQLPNLRRPRGRFTRYADADSLRRAFFLRSTLLHLSQQCGSKPTTSYCCQHCSSLLSLYLYAPQNNHNGVVWLMHGVQRVAFIVSSVLISIWHVLIINTLLEELAYVSENN